MPVGNILRPGSTRLDQPRQTNESTFVPAMPGPTSLGPQVLYPRAFVQLNTTVSGQDTSTSIVPTKANFTRRTFQQADEAEVTILGSALPWQQMAIEGVHMILFMGNVDRVDRAVDDPSFTQDTNPTPRHPNLRF